MLEINNTILLIIDVQEKLAKQMYQKEAMTKNIVQMVKGAMLLEIPIILTEQNPKGLGTIIPEITELFSDFNPLPKMCFSCCAENGFMDKLQETGRTQILVAGIESHICVYQTAADLINMDYEVQVVSDAVSSRVLENKLLALQRMNEAGAVLTGVEMALFELIKTADYEHFRKLSSIIR